MSIEASCSCGKRYRLKDELAGKRIRCPACKGVIAIAAPQPKPAPPSESGGLGLLAEAIARDSQTAPPKLRQCRLCQAQVPPEAASCPSCGALMQGGSTASSPIPLAAPDSGSAPPAPLAAAPPPVAAQSVPAFGEVVRRQSEPKGDLIPIPPALGLVGKILGGILGALTIIGGIRVLMQEIPPGAPADAVTMITSIAVGMLASGLLLLLRLPMPGVGFTRAAYTYLGTLYGVGFGLIVIRGAFKDIRYFLAAVAAVALAGAVWGLRPKGRIVDLVMLCVLALPLLGMISTVVRFLSRVVLNF